MKGVRGVSQSIAVASMLGFAAERSFMYAMKPKPKITAKTAV